jgi:hypothetical protein
MARRTEVVVDEQIETPTENGDETEETKSKRERVDLETLDPMERVQFNITVPAGLKLAYLKAGEERGLAGSFYARGRSTSAPASARMPVTRSARLKPPSARRNSASSLRRCLSS